MQTAYANPLATEWHPHCATCRDRGEVQVGRHWERPVYDVCPDCPRCFCGAWVRDHRDVEIGECWAELEVYGEDVLPAPFEVRSSDGSVLVPMLGGWVTPAQWRERSAS